MVNSIISQLLEFHSSLSSINGNLSHQKEEIFKAFSENNSRFEQIQNIFINSKERFLNSLNKQKQINEEQTLCNNANWIALLGNFNKMVTSTKCSQSTSKTPKEKVKKIEESQVKTNKTIKKEQTQRATRKKIIEITPNVIDLPKLDQRRVCFIVNRVNSIRYTNLLNNLYMFTSIKLNNLKVIYSSKSSQN